MLVWGVAKGHVVGFEADPKRPQRTQYPLEKNPESRFYFTLVLGLHPQSWEVIDHKPLASVHYLLHTEPQKAS